MYGSKFITQFMHTGNLKCASPRKVISCRQWQILWVHADLMLEETCNRFNISNGKLLNIRNADGDEKFRYQNDLYSDGGS